MNKGPKNRKWRKIAAKKLILAKELVKAGVIKTTEEYFKVYSTMDLQKAINGK